MKTALTATAILALAACDGADHHGAAFRDLPRVSVTELAERPEANLRKEVRLSGTLTRQ
jgi:hypothetical protein